MLEKIEAWSDGFQQGQKLSFFCPFPVRTVELSLWRRAWLEGAAKMLGLQYEELPTQALLMQLGYVKTV